MVSIVSGVDIVINPHDDPGLLIRYSIELINRRKQKRHILQQRVSRFSNPKRAVLVFSEIPSRNDFVYDCND
jgi:hypothetical protein